MGRNAGLGANMKRLSVLLVTVVVLLALPAGASAAAAAMSSTLVSSSAARSYSPPCSLASPWVAPVVLARSAVPGTIFSDGFETGASAWKASGTPTWAVTTYRAAVGAASVYCAGSQIAAPGPYANNMDNWLEAGPFDLSKVTAATFSYRFWMSTPKDADWLMAGVSTDGRNFAGFVYSGDSGGWLARDIDLTKAAGLGNVCGRSQVWFGLSFRSDASVTGEGAYVDDVQLLDTSLAPQPLPDLDISLDVRNPMKHMERVVRLGTRLMVDGRVQDTADDSVDVSGIPVVLTVQRSTTSGWVTVKVGSAVVGAKGGFAWRTYKPSKKGEYTVQATIAATADHGTGQSPSLQFFVR